MGQQHDQMTIIKNLPMSNYNYAKRIMKWKLGFKKILGSFI